MVGEKQSLGCEITEALLMNDYSLLAKQVNDV